MKKFCCLIMGFLATIYSIEIENCPDPCRCSSSNLCQEIWVSCYYKGLTTIPNKYPANTCELYLTGNDISRIEKESFSNLTKLQRLGLTDNKISSIDNRAFIGLTKLEYISLADNDLAFIDQKTFYGLRNLRFLFVDLNPFHCDCLLEGFVQYIKEFQLNSTNSIDTPKCATPIKQTGMGLKDISPTDLSCEKSTSHTRL
ncbi:slit homolog 3 protein-like [Saccostrea cucullata]|uniref:slit homolog 3 protein-like n=1 Tax=Saccostrea cuccullata TaxID=36930 RepID=UPI002ED40356